MKQRFCIFFALLSIFVFAQTGLQVDELVYNARKITLSSYPDADWAVIDDVTTIKCREDATSETIEEVAIKVLTEKGRKENRIIQEHYDTAYSTSVFESIQVISPSGKVIDIKPQEVCQETIDEGQMASNIYNPSSKVLTASIPALNVNDILHYVVRRNTYKVRMPGQFVDYLMLEYDAPIKKTSIRLELPASLKLAHKEILSPVAGTVSYALTSGKDGKEIHTWIAKDVPMALPEPKMPSMYTCVQRLMLSTIPAWKDVSSWYWSLCEPHFKATPEMKAKVKELIDGKLTEREKINAIFTFVSQDIRYMGETTETVTPGYEPHDAGVTFAKRHGVCRDKAALLTAMLRCAGIDAYPVLIKVGPKMDKEVPIPYFNHAITAIRKSDGSYTLLDSTNENTVDWLPAYLDNRSYLVATPKGDDLRVSSVRPAAENVLKSVVHCDVNAQGTLLGYAKIEFVGINDDAYRGSFAEWSEEERRIFLEKIVRRSISGAKLTRMKLLPENIRDTSAPFCVEVSFEAPDYVVRNGKLSYIAPPVFGQNMGIVNWMLPDVSLDKRRFPMLLNFTAAGEETLTMHIAPELGALTALPKYSQIDGGTMTWKREAAFEGNLFSCKTLHAINTMEFSPEEYLKLKSNLKTIDDDCSKMLVFNAGEKRGDTEPQPDIVILNDHQEYILNSFQHYSRKATTRLVVTTYKGLKDCSDMQIAYCPDFESVKVESAKVYNGDECIEVKQEEIKCMDTGWSLSAPRYPGEKSIVVNFPSVQIGSVLEYTLLYEYNGDAPFSYIMTFGGFDPIQSCSVTLKAPKGIELCLNVSQQGFLQKKSGMQPITEECSEEDDCNVYTWKAAELYPLKRESNLPPLRFLLPSVSVFATNWKDLALQLNDAFMEKAIYKGEMLEALVEKLKPYDAYRQLFALKRYISKNIRLAGPAVNEVPLQCMTKPEETLRFGYGNLTDRALIYYAALKMLDYSPELYWVTPRLFSPATQEKMLSHVTMSQFTVPMIKVHACGRDIWFNDGDQYSALGSCSYEKHQMLAEDGTIQTLRVDKEYATSQEDEYNFELLDNGDATMNCRITYRGTDYNYMKKFFAEQTPEERRRYLLRLVSAYSSTAKPEGIFKTEFEEYPGILSFSARLPEYAVAVGDTFSLPLLNSFNGAVVAATQDRYMPYESTAFTHKRSKYSYCFAQCTNCSLSWSPVVNRYVFPVSGIFKAKSSVKSESVTFEFEEERVPFLIQADEYGKLLEFNRQVTHPALNTILFTRAKNADE